MNHLDMSLDDIIMEDRRDKGKDFKKPSKHSSSDRGKQSSSMGNNGSGWSRSRLGGRLEGRLGNVPRVLKIDSRNWSAGKSNSRGAGDGRWRHDLYYSNVDSGLRQHSASLRSSSQRLGPRGYAGSSRQRSLTWVNNQSSGSSRFSRAKRADRAVDQPNTAIRGVARFAGRAFKEFDRVDPIAIRGTGGMTSVLVDNLDPGVNVDDLKMIFMECGDIKHCSIYNDQTGKDRTSMAKITFFNRDSALNAVRKFNNRIADGRVLKVGLRDADDAMQLA